MSKMPADVKKALELFLEDPALYFEQAYDDFELVFELIDSEQENCIVRAYHMPDSPSGDLFRVVETDTSTGLPRGYKPGNTYEYDCFSDTVIIHMERAIVQKGYKLRYENLNYIGRRLDHKRMKKGLEIKNKSTNYFAKEYNSKTVKNVKAKMIKDND